MTAYYNEIDPFAAEWLRKLISAGHIASGDVDERDMRDVKPGDLKGYTQIHFFAGIGGWSHALRLAGWPDDMPVWTGSCPCQPFSAAGKGLGTSDERHLWPVFFDLIRECRPQTVFGEQVASKDALHWFDLVSTDLEGEGYAAAAVDLCAAGIGAPHIRQRLYWVADAMRSGTDNRPGEGLGAGKEAHRTDGCLQGERLRVGEQGSSFGMGHAFNESCKRESRSIFGTEETKHGARQQIHGNVFDGLKYASSSVGGMADAAIQRHDRWWTSQKNIEQRKLKRSCDDIGMADAYGGDTSPEWEQCSGQQRQQQKNGSVSCLGSEGASQTDGFWSNPDWLLCRDGKWRPVESGTFPLANGVPARVGRLRGYGNAIVPPLAAIFIEAYKEILR